MVDGNVQEAREDEARRDIARCEGKAGSSPHERIIISVSIDETNVGIEKWALKLGLLRIVSPSHQRERGFAVHSVKPVS